MIHKLGDDNVNEKEIELIEIASSVTMVNSRPPQFLESPPSLFIRLDIPPLLLGTFSTSLIWKMSTLPVY